MAIVILHHLLTPLKNPGDLPSIAGAQCRHLAGQWDHSVGQLGRVDESLESGEWLPDVLVHVEHRNPVCEADERQEGDRRARRENGLAEAHHAPDHSQPHPADETHRWRRGQPAVLADARLGEMPE